MARPYNGDMDACVHCKQAIMYHETSIDDFWAHVGGAGFCDETLNWLTAKDWAHPKTESCEISGCK